MWRWLWLITLAAGCVFDQPDPPILEVERCVFAADFDVGNARVGHGASRTLTVSNPLDRAAEVFIEVPAAPFSVEPTGLLRLDPHESRLVTVRFSPLAAGDAAQAWHHQPSTDCTATEVTLTGRALDAPLSFSPGRLDFGTLAAGASRSLTVEVRNHTRAALSLTALRFSAPAFRSLTPLPLTVPAEGVTSLELEAIAPSAQPFDALLLATTDAAEQPELSLPLLANRTAPCLAASPARVDFPAVEAGCHSADARVSVTNTCPHEVKLGERTVSPGFVFISSPSQAVLAPGEPMDFALTYGPALVGTASGAVSLSVDVLDGAQVLTVPLAGEGTPALEVEESELMPTLVPPRDVLLVIDDSAAMLPLADSVRRNLGDFARAGVANQEDVRIGVMSTSTAPAELGRLRHTDGGVAWLNNPTPEALQELAAVKGLSTARSSCLEVFQAALAPPLRTDPTELGGMLRPGASLELICLTNGRDAVEVAPLPLVTSIAGHLPQRHSVAVVARFADSPLLPASCGGELEHGPLSLLVAQTNGVREEICTPNWSIALDRRTYSFGYRTNFYLHQRPDLSRGPLRVFVDDVEFPPRNPDPSSGRIWEYSSEVNAVNFEPLSVPAPGRTLRFRFTPECAR